MDQRLAFGIAVSLPNASPGGASRTTVYAVVALAILNMTLKIGMALRCADLPNFFSH